MNIRRITIILFVLALVFLVLSPSRAQDATPVPTEEAVPVDVVTTTTTTTTSPIETAGLTLTWLLAFLALWQAAGIAYAVTVEKTLKPVLYGILSQFTEDVRLHHAVLILAVFGGAFYVVSSGGVNLFVGAPFSLFATASPAFLLVLNSVFVAVGAFIGHELWQTFESWLKKAKAVTDALSATNTASVQSRRLNTGAPADGVVR